MPPVIFKQISLDFQSGEVIQPAGVSTAGTIPAGAEIVHIVAEGGACYYQFGDGIASVLSAGFVPQDERVTEGPIRDLSNGIVFFAAGGVTIHVQYYQQNRGR